jgi:hypothetical protein
LTKPSSESAPRVKLTAQSKASALNKSCFICPCL